MNGHDMIKLAGQEAPEVMEKVALALAVLEKRDPEEARRLTEELLEVADYTVEKLAYGPLAQLGWGVAAAAGVGLAGTMANDLYDVAKRGITRNNNYNRILSANPELKKSFDKDRLRRSFDAIHRYAPEMTADPTAGGALLKAVAEFPGNEHVVIKDLINTRKNLIDAKTTQFRMGQVPALELPSDMDIRREELALRGEKRDIAATEREIAENKRRARLDRINVLQGRRMAALKAKEIAGKGDAADLALYRARLEEEAERARANPNQPINLGGVPKPPRR